MSTNNSINTPQITLGGPLTFSGAFTTTITVTGNTAVTLPLTGTLLSSATYPVAGAGAGKIIISDGVNWIASTPTFANTYAASSLLYSNGANSVQGLATNNDSVLVTNGVGVPSLSNTLPSGLTIPGFAASGANADITSLTGLTGVIKAPTAIQSAASVNLLTFTYTAVAVNYINIKNNISGANPIISATGSDAAVQLGFESKGGVAFLADSTTTNGAEFFWYNAAGNHFTAIKKASAEATDLVLTLPGVDGNLDHPLVTNGSGVLSFRTTPTFSAYANSATSLAANAQTKVDLKAEEWDIGGYYDAPNSKFTPLKAGIYHVNAAVIVAGANVANTSRYFTTIYKNGSFFKNGNECQAVNAGNYQSVVSALISMNGTTDNLEIYFNNGNAATTVSASSSQNQTYFQAVWVAPLS